MIKVAILISFFADVETSWINSLNHVDEVFSFTSKVRFNWASFPGGEEGICSKSVTYYIFNVTAVIYNT